MARRRVGLAEGRLIGRVDREELHRSIVRDVAHTLRNGAVAEYLDGHASYLALDRAVLVDAAGHRRRELSLQHDQAEQRARRLRTYAADAHDQQEARELLAQARQESAKATRLGEALERLAQRSDQATLPQEFEGEVAFIVAGLSALLADSGRMPAEGRSALQSLISDFHLVVEPPVVRWSLCLLLPADGRVVRLGPFEGSVAARGRVRTQAESRFQDAETADAVSRRHLRSDLVAAGVPSALAGAALLAPGGYLRAVLLGRDVRWPGCAPDFDHESFNAHVRQCWADLGGWGRGVYAQTSPQRQRLADLVARHGGHISLADLRPMLSSIQMKPNDVYTLTLPKRSKNPATPPWPPTVLREGDWGSGSPATMSIVVSPRCQLCHGPATVVVRVPEVPDALLCARCRVMPSRPDLVFPPMYLDLGVSGGAVGVVGSDQD